MADRRGDEMNRPEIWIVSNFPPPAHGVSVFNAELAAFFESRGFKVRRFPIGAKGSIANVEQGGIARALDDLKVIASLLVANLQSARREVTIYFTPSQFGGAVARDALIAFVARLVPGRRLVAHLHGCRWIDTRKRGGAIARCMEFALHKCASVICLGENYAAKMRDAAGIRTAVGIPNGVASVSSASAKTLPPAGGTIELLFLSNLMAAKGLWENAEALRILARRGIPVRLTLAGSWFKPEERERFEREYAAELAEGRMVIEPFAAGEAKAALFRQAHFFLLPTQNEFEGQPLTVIEAMTHAVPPITRATGGIPDLFAFDGGSELCQPSFATADAVAGAVSRLIAQPTLYEQLSERVLRYSRAELTQDRCFGRVLGEVAPGAKRS